MQELTELIQLLEAQIPANPLNPANARLRKSLEKELRAYFRALADAFPYTKLDTLYMKHVKESLGAEAAEILDAILWTFSSSLKTTLAGHLSLIYARGYAETVKWAGLPFEGPPSAYSVEWADKYSGTLVKGINDETRSQLGKIISDGIQNKRGPAGISRDLRSTFTDMSKVRADMISRTETAKALGEGFLDSAKQLGVKGKSVVLSNNPCEICIANAAEGVIPLNQAFQSGNTTVPFHPNCLLGDTNVIPLGLVALSRAFYKGQVVYLQTRSGHKLTVTPNHPILTGSGFVSANRLNIGNNIICCIDSERMIFGMNPNYNYVPVSIEEIWNTYSVSMGMSSIRMPVSTEDFHGDAVGFNGQIDIINTDSLLWNNTLNPFTFEHAGQECLDDRYSKFSGLSRLCSQFHLGNRLLTPPNGGMGFGGNSETLRFGELSHVNSESFTIATRSNTMFNQTPSHDISSNSPFLTERLLSLTRQVSLDEIVDIRDFYFSGHVYNLQSLEGLYIANNIFVKNCECAIAPEMMI
jgi:hypothetical protein